MKYSGCELILEAWLCKLKQEEEMENVESETLLEDWVCKLKQEAIQRGVNRDVVEKVLAGITISEKILELDLNKPEVKLSGESYITRFVSDNRISNGLVAFKEHLPLLNEVAGKYGVPSPVLVAIWGIESNYGAFTGNWDTVQALLTLAYGSVEQRRASFFREELMHMLRIIEQGHACPGDRRLKGSWAGAMGQCQFMPSSFQTYAVDYDGDGCKDIWESHADVFASMANYLQLHGWKKECPIAQKVTVPETLDTSVFGLTVKKTLAEWNNYYKLQVLEQEYLQDETASLVAPDGVRGPVYLVFNNFTTIMRYNPSVLYAIAVYELSNIIANNSESQTGHV